jgi:uncharacterized Zn finger protein
MAPTFHKLTKDEVRRTRSTARPELTEAEAKKPGSSTLPGLTEAEVRDWIPDPYFSRGQNYYRRGNVFNTIRRGEALEARCEGSEPQPYRIKITFSGSDHLRRARCSCPMGGSCKHVVAVLLAWVHEPETFVEREPLHTVLARKSREELMALVMEMLEREPELEELVDFPLPVVGEGGEPVRRTPLDVEPYRHRLRASMRYADDWEATYDIATEVSSVVDKAEQFAEYNDWVSAQALYQLVLDEILPEYGSTHDEGEIASELERAVEGLTECLEIYPDNPVARRTILLALFKVLEWDVQQGGFGLSEMALPPLLEATTPEEQREIRGWLSDTLTTVKASTEFGESWRRQALGRMLLRFAEQESDVDGFLQQLAREGLHELRFDKLMDVGRLDEAAQVAEQHLAGATKTLLHASSRLEAAGRGETALALVEAAAARGDRADSVLAWLEARYSQGGRLAEALDLNLERWRQRQTLELYRSMREQAKLLGRWDALQPRLLRELEQKRDHILLTRIYLDEQAWDAAWDTAEQTATRAMFWSDMRLEVARASETQRPARAAALYLEVAQKFIQQKSRTSYASAAEYLRRVRDLYHTLEWDAEWTRLIAELRGQHKKLPALQDELRKAGL